MHKFVLGAVAAFALSAAALAQGVNPPVAPNIPPPNNTNASIYNGNWELFAGGSYQFAKATSANLESITTTNVPGAQLGLRLHLNDITAAEVRLAFAEPTQLYAPNASVKSFDTEVSGDYVFTIPTSGGIRPFFLGGMGMIHYSPLAASSFPGSQAVWRFAFNYGAGVDFAISPHWGLRFEYRGLIYRVPDFNLIGIKKWNHMPEPDIGLVWHF